jgi:DNA-binding transcriptional ArsR family regulator
MPDSPTPATSSIEPAGIAPIATEQRAKIFAALSDPTRLRMVELLAQQRELSGSEIANQLGISLALYCHHSKALTDVGLVRIRRDGQTRYNSLNQELLLHCFKSFEGLCQSGMKGEKFSNREPNR